MTNTTSIQELGSGVEQLVALHLAASRSAAEAALQRAFESGNGTPRRTRSAVRSPGSGKRRGPAEMATLCERLYEAVCVKPGESMVILAQDLGASVRELNRPMTHLKGAGRVRSIGQRHLTRYFPAVAKEPA